VNFTGETVVAGNSFFSYDLSLGGSASNSVELQTNDFATIIDFGPANPVVGYSGAFIADWSVSQNFVGPIPTTPLNLNPVANDNPTVLDLTFTWIGPTTPLGGTTGSLDLGTFTVQSGTNATQTSTSNYVSTDEEGGPVFLPADEIGTTIVPFGQPGNLTPLPSSAWGGLALFGLLGCGALSRKIRQVA
jgi:hypothetical protein